MKETKERTIKEAMKKSKALTWDDLAEDYKKATGESAKIRPMDAIFEWAEKQTEKYYVDPKVGSIHRILKS